MTKLIIDAAKDKIFLMIINNNINYHMSFENSKNNYEKLTLLVYEFLKMKNLDINKVKQIYVNRGPGSFAGIRNSLAIVKAFNVASQIDYYSFSFTDFVGENDIKFENIPALCKKFKVKKNLINPIYLS
tara:strand:+ start:43 stop:429 length:387 start_codon:yes stop_codon:yes gene_type:complete